MKNFLDCFKDMMYMMMCFVIIWGGGLIAFPQHAFAWSFMMFVILGVSFCGAVLLGAQEEQKRRWDKEELEAADNIIDSDKKYIITKSKDHETRMYDPDTLEIRFNKFKKRRTSK